MLNNNNCHTVWPDTFKIPFQINVSNREDQVTDMLGVHLAESKIQILWNSAAETWARL